MNLSYKFRFVALLIFLSGFLFSCQENKKYRKINPKKLQEELIQANKRMLKSEDNKIADYLSTNPGFQLSESGLRYKIIEEGVGEPIRIGEIVYLDYQIMGLDSTLYYSSEKDGVKMFQVGKGNVASGLQEGILLLRPRSEAMFILPSHLAFGLVGDEEIPVKTTLIYHIKVIDIK